jgi:capsular polysaccharide biosynthesis protein
LDFAASLRMILRRWYVVLPALTLVAAASNSTARAVQPSYQVATSLILLVPSATASQRPETSTDRLLANPYLQFTNSLKVTAEVLATVITNDQTRRHLRASGLPADFEVITTSEVSPTPMLTITATSRQESDARRTLRAVVTLARAELAKRQVSAGATKDSLIQMKVASAPTTAKRVVGSTVRAVAATVALGLAMTFGAAYCVDALAERRRSRRGRRGRTRRHGHRQPEPRQPQVPEAVGVHIAAASSTRRSDHPQIGYPRNRKTKA